MDLVDVLAEMGGLQSVARELGVSENTARAGAAQLLPAILGGLKKKTQQQPAGIEGLRGLFDALGGDGLLDDVLAPEPTHVDRGNEVLGQIFGSKETSRAVAQNAASRSGLDPSLLKRMLPMLAMLAAGYLARQRGGADAPAGVPAAPRTGLGGLLGGVASMLDLDGDGNPLDDILRLVNSGSSSPRR